MAKMSPAQSRQAVVPVVRLAELPGLAAELAERVRAGGFRADVVVYIETGARLLAHEVGRELGVEIVPMWVSRGGSGLKQKVAPLVAKTPVWLRDGLRRLEEWSGVHRHTRRRAALAHGVELAGKRVLLLDDAADTGRTIGVARELVKREGGAGEVKVAVLAATTPAGRAAVDFFVLEKNSRMPWSSDSDERVETERRAEELRPKYAPRDF